MTRTLKPPPIPPTTLPGEHPSVCALITTFNRRDTTLACLRALQAAATHAQLPPAAVVVDDASRDGTANAIRSAFPWAEVIDSAGDLYWSRGMHQAFAAAMAEGFDHYLWLNDDTHLGVDALSRLVDCHRRLTAVRSAPLIIVGSTVDAVARTPTYGGQRRPSRWLPLRVALLAPADTEQRCDAMTGNIVLVSAEAAACTGNIDGGFEHAMGDTDYALRATAAGVEIWLAPGILGTCSENDTRHTYRDTSLPLRTRWRLMLSRKGLPWRSWLRLVSRHGGLLWPITFAWPYGKLLARGVLMRPARR